MKLVQAVTLVARNTGRTQTQTKAEDDLQWFNKEELYKQTADRQEQAQIWIQNKDTGNKKEKLQSKKHETMNE